MKKPVKLLLFISITTIVSCSTMDRDLTKYVDQYIGTGGHGHVFMGANVPFGFVQLGPTSIPQSWDWTSGYHISDTTVIGFSHLHLSGTGIGDLSDVVFMPVIGKVNHDRGNVEDPESGMWSYFTRANEKVQPGYYATRLDRYGIDVELTATERVGLHKYTFPRSLESRVVVDLENGTCWDTPMEGHIKVIDDRTIEGYRYSRGWAYDQKVYFTALFSKPFKTFRLYEKNVLKKSNELTARRVYGEALFDTEDKEVVYVKVALSPVSIENARLNMQEEMPDWNFKKVKKEAVKKWNSELNKIKIQTSDSSVKRIFYTALYHTMIAPSLFCDVNGDYRGADGKTHTSDGFTNYTTFSLWDTYRAAHPLMTIIHPEKMGDIINTMINIFRQQGKLPVWHLMGCETNCMVGNPAIPVVADAILKGIEDFDHEEAYNAMKRSAMLDERGLGLLKEYGYIPCDMYNESVATALEYALADWSVAQVALHMGKMDDYEYFTTRSKSYSKYFDHESQFMRGLTKEGKFREPFNPFASTHRNDDYTEGNAWQYTWLVPHDIDGLMSLFGSREAFITKLDSLFVITGNMSDEASPDISGLIGQYAHGNEPSHHTAYIYTKIGEPWKSASLVRRVLSDLYHDQPDGLSGNEDVGQMSAWYILSAMGFYQMEPAGGRYYFGSPIVDKAVINVGAGKKFTIKAIGNSDDNKYIQSVKLNSEPYNKPYIDFKDIATGGYLEIIMGPTKDVLWYGI